MKFRIVAASIAALLLAPTASNAQQFSKNAQRDGVSAVAFTAHLFFEESGELSPNIFELEELAVWNFTAQWKGNNGGKFSGFLIKVRLESRTKREVFAQGMQAQIILRDRKTKKMLRTWSISDIYVGDKGVSYRAQFFSNLDCEKMEVTLVSSGTRITRDLPFACGE